MIELGQLEAHREEFAKRHTRVVAVSNDNQEDSRKTKEQLPSLVVVADSDDKLISAAEAAAPTTILIDKRGTVRGVYRPSHRISRFSPTDVLTMVDKDLRE
jgi:peroxiredoxin